MNRVGGAMQIAVIVERDDERELLETQASGEGQG
jgi:hypothetical protein